MGDTFAELVAKIPQPPSERDFTEVYFESNIELCYAHNRGYNRAIRDIRIYLNSCGRPTSFFDAMIDELQNYENDSFATDVIGG
jgi:hypothetical protein